MQPHLMSILFIPLSSAFEGIVNVNLISDQCFERAVPHILRCQTDFQETVYATVHYRPFYMNLDHLSRNDLSVVCCGLWDMSACMKAAANGWSDCPTLLTRLFTQDIEALKHRSDFGNCTKHFRQGSVKCRFPLWSTIAIILGSIILLLLFNCCLQRR